MVSKSDKCDDELRNASDNEHQNAFDDEVRNGNDDLQKCMQRRAPITKAATRCKNECEYEEYANGLLPAVHDAVGPLGAVNVRMASSACICERGV